MKNYLNLVNKYNKAVPRYTSYPPVPFWNGKHDHDEWISHIKSSYDPSVGLDLYIHVPFCERLCYYCGCNRTITKNHDVEVSFCHLILKEWKLYVEKLGFTPVVNSLHFGGGTPNFLSKQNLTLILEEILVNKSKDFKGSIEIDPRTIKEEHYEVFKNFDISRVSLGIQDFDVNVQTAINRFQSFELVQRVVNDLRSSGVASINFDLIYGLPRQTIETVGSTFDQVRLLKPDLIAFYSYAHLPERLKNQKLIKSEDLPDAELKRQLYLTGKRKLEEDGYVEIGMDHFARPGSYLYKAMVEKSIHRNFMGYVDKKSSVLVGLGPTAISDSSLSFVQNNKNLEEYTKSIQNNEFSFTTGHVQSMEDTNVQNLIQNLMCNREILIKDLEKILDYESVLKDLEEFKFDGILEFVPEKIIINSDAMGFVRNVAHVFDFHFKNQVQNTKFSQSI